MCILLALPRPDDLFLQVSVGIGGKLLVAELDAQGVLDDAVEGRRRGDVRQRLGGEGEAVHYGVTDGGCFLDEDFSESLVGTGLGVRLVDVLEEDRDEAGREERRANFHDGEVGEPVSVSSVARPVGKEHESNTDHRNDGREQGKLSLVKTI